MAIRIDTTRELGSLLERVSQKRMQSLGESVAKIAASQAGYVVLARKAQELAPTQDPAKDLYMNQYLPSPFGDPKRTRKYPGMKPGDLKRSIKIYKVKPKIQGTVEYHIAPGISKKVGAFTPGWYGHMVNAGHVTNHGVMPAKAFSRFGPMFRRDGFVVATKAGSKYAARLVNRKLTAQLFMQRAEQSARAQAIRYGLEEAAKFVRRAL